MNLAEYLATNEITQQELADAINKDACRHEGALGVSQGAISQWLTAGVIPLKRALQLERVSGGKMTCEDLRPDFYPPTSKLLNSPQERENDGAQ